MYYHTNEVRDNFKKSINQINTLSGKVYSDYKSKSALYKELQSNIVNQSLEPFKSISTEKTAFNNAYKAIGAKKSEVLALNKRFEKIASGKSKIQSNEPEWGELKDIKKQMSQKGEEMNTLTSEYTNFSNQLGNKITQSGFRPMNKTEFIDQIKKNQETLKTSLGEIFKNVDKYRTEIENAHNNKLINDSIYDSKSTILNEMTMITKKVKEANNSLRMNKARFQEKTKNQEKIWTGKNTIAHESLEEIKKQIGIIKAAQGQFNALSNKLNQQ
jgi:chromosome segregation ATPase